MSLSGIMTAPLPAASALADAMALLRVCSDPAGAKAILDAIGEAVAAGEAALQKRADEIETEQHAREAGLVAREATVTKGEVELKAKVDKINGALARFEAPPDRSEPTKSTKPQAGSR